MITRPLDLAARLRPAPRNLDALFFVNAGLLVLFFALFGSRFVLAPGLGVNFRLPTVAGAHRNARPPTHTITVTNTRLVFGTGGPLKIEDLDRWLKEEARGMASPILLIKGEEGVPLSLLAEITGAAYRAGFADVIAAAEEPSARKSGGR